MIWWLSTKTNSPLMLALAGLAAFVPQLILGPFAGVWIDRMKRKRVVIAADLFMGTVAALFSLCFLFTSPPAWSVCLVLGIRAVGTVFHTPAMQALVPLLVPMAGASFFSPALSCWGPFWVESCSAHFPCGSFC